VVGLGPAGGSAALMAAKAGLTVLGVEKKKQAGMPVQCAEFIPLPMSQYAAEAPVRTQTITGMKTYLPSGEKEKTDFPGLMIDRQKFDEAIANNAAAAGAKLVFGAALQTLDRANKVATIGLDKESVAVSYRYVIAADGPHSIVAKNLGLPALKIVNTRQYTVPLLKPFADTDIWVSDEFPGGYAWLFPKGDWANLGLGADKRFEQDLKAPLDKLHKQLMEQGIVGEEITYRTGGAIPVGGMRENLVIDETYIFAGDAAGLTHPITGAGISAAVQSGEWAGQAVAKVLQGDTDALEDYEDEVRDQYEVTLERAIEKREWLENVWHTQLANDDEIMRVGWIAFDEYFQPVPKIEIKDVANS
ncbi:MAG: NAD(P)/FAD-dependent oxidoreductase, partial [Gammaproteobacteria bacterium]|nr:NAD(P)/FAD-dependent oxidoreductase [Gammaproteobacteria bacterium]